MSDSMRPHRQQPTRLPCPWNSPGKNTGVGSHFLLQCMKVKSESQVAQSCPTLCAPWTAAYKAPSAMGFSRQEYWSGVPLPSPYFMFRVLQTVPSRFSLGSLSIPPMVTDRQPDYIALLSYNLFFQKPIYGLRSKAFWLNDSFLSIQNHRCLIPPKSPFLS